MNDIASQALWFEVAIREIGVHEQRGDKHHPRIIEYLRSTDLGAELTDEIAWCAAFAGWCLQQAGYESTRKAAARSYLLYGAPTLLQRGAIVVFSRGQPHQGHVGFVWGASEAAIDVLGGNQNNEVSVKAYPRDRLLAARWPTDAQLKRGEFR